MDNEHTQIQHHKKRSKKETQRNLHVTEKKVTHRTGAKKQGRMRNELTGRQAYRYLRTVFEESLTSQL